MRRLQKRAWSQPQLQDALNKVRHYQQADNPAYVNAVNLLGKDVVISYLADVILNYNGQEQLLETEVHNFLYNGQLNPQFQQEAQALLPQLNLGITNI